ncbi:MAG TPA: hypothetical protein VES38_03835, partial [Methylotenera sp.]|nr:hypothetical protein [Methylotenera sp.]
MVILPGMGLSQINSQGLLINRTMRILYVNIELNQLVAIAVEPKSSKGRLYFTCPKIFRHTEIVKLIEAHCLKLLITGIKLRPDVLASDEALNKKYKSDPCKAVLKRQERYKLIESLVQNIDDHPLLFDPQTREEIIDKHISTLEITTNQILLKRQIRQTIFQFFAEGASLNALTPFFATRGGRGKERLQKSKLGRQNAPTKAGIIGHQGFLMSDDDKKICGFAFSNYLIWGRTCEHALRKMWSNFYSFEEQDDAGKTQSKLLPKNLRPSRAQFERWGSKESGQEAWQKEFNPQQLARLDRALLGKSNNQIYAVGQVGAIDSTTTDTEFVSVTDRLKRIGLATRMLVVDSLYGYIPGFYMGLEAAGAATVKLALLHAMSEKTEWLKFLGLVDMNPDDWLPIRFGNHICDNTDARNQINMGELNSLGIGLKYVPTHRSDLNATVESSHHSLHRLVDHLLPGTTRGRRLQRGDGRPDLSARMTVMEGIRETTKAIHFHNTRPLDIPITLEMRRDLIDKGLSINRLNLTKLAIQKGNLHVTLISREQAIATLATPILGTFTAKGVKLHRTDKGERAFIEPIRYISKHPTMISKFQEAKTNRRVAPTHHDATFLYNPYQPNEIYYQDIHSGELFNLELESPDDEWFEYTIPDYLSAMQQDAIYKHFVDEGKQQQHVTFEQALETTINGIENEYATVAAKSPPIPKSKIAREKK